MGWLFTECSVKRFARIYSDVAKGCIFRCVESIDRKQWRQVVAAGFSEDLRLQWEKFATLAVIEASRSMRPRNFDFRWT